MSCFLLRLSRGLFFSLDNAFNRGRGTGVERPNRPRTFRHRWDIQQRVIKYAMNDSHLSIICMIFLGVKFES